MPFRVGGDALHHLWWRGVPQMTTSEILPRRRVLYTCSLIGSTERHPGSKPLSAKPILHWKKLPVPRAELDPPHVLGTYLRGDREPPNRSAVHVSGDMSESLIPNVRGPIFPSSHVQDGMHGCPRKLSAPEPKRRLRGRMLCPGDSVGQVPAWQRIDGGRIAGETAYAIRTIHHNCGRRRPFRVEAGCVAPIKYRFRHSRKLASAADDPAVELLPLVPRERQNRR